MVINQAERSGDKTMQNPLAFVRGRLQETECSFDEAQFGRMFQLGFRASVISILVPTTSFGILLTR